jgi:hypothetical protein
MKNKIFFWDGLGKGVNALFMRVSGVFKSPGLKPWATEYVNPKPKTRGMEIDNPKPRGKEIGKPKPKFRGKEIGKPEISER